jgi:anti-sigma regulatory factor (Ser/Thr protein kinase)
LTSKEAPEEFVRQFNIVGDDFSSAGSVSITVKNLVKGVGFSPELVRRVAIAAFEAEMNVVMYGGGGILELHITASGVRLVIKDQGPGIPDLDLAMQEGWSTATAEMREMGFGAGMGLPNMKKNSDRMHIVTGRDEGTTVLLEMDAR